MGIINSVFTWIIKKRIHQIELFQKYPHDVQKELLVGLLQKAKGTEWGQKYGYEDIKSFREFAERTPINNYEGLYPYIERVLKGEQNVLWPTEIKMFAKSSGTTNARSKYIPVSKEALEDCHFKGGKDMLSIFVNNYPETQLFEGKALSIGGSLQANPFNDKTLCGDVSALLTKNLPIWAEYMRAPSLEIAMMDKWEEKIEAMALAVAGENITSMSGVPTWTVVLLERILEMQGKKDMSEVWPNMEVFFHGAVSFDPYRALFKKLIPSPTMSYLEIYNASEGFFGIQDQKDSSEMLLMLDYGVFYEFIPLAEAEDENPKTIPLEEVELGKVYAVVISTNAGLWRYKIGDTIRFTNLSPYRIKIAGRTKHFINAFGEEVMVENADAAILEACKQTGAEIRNYTAGPVYLGERQQGGHEWIIEFVSPPDDINRFTDLVDTVLRQVNSDYDAKRRHDIALVRPVIHSAPEGLFLQWMKKRGKMGGQHKVPRLANNREYLDDILLMMNYGR